MAAIPAIMAITAHLVIDFVKIQAVYQVKRQKKAGKGEIPSSF